MPYRPNGSVDVIIETEYVPSCLAGRTLQKADVKALQDVWLFVLRVARRDGGLEQKREVMRMQCARRLAQLWPKEKMC